MKFNCDDCGLCCMHMRTPPFCGPSDPQWAALPVDLQNEINEFIMSRRARYQDNHHGGDGPCLWLDLATGKCRHYELRPDVCREFDVGEEPCREVVKENPPYVKEPTL